MSIVQLKKGPTSEDEGPHLRRKSIDLTHGPTLYGNGCVGCIIYNRLLAKPRSQHISYGFAKWKLTP
jgi:hypothetical protein